MIMFSSRNCWPFQVMPTIKNCIPANKHDKFTNKSWIWSHKRYGFPGVRRVTCAPPLQVMALKRRKTGLAVELEAPRPMTAVCCECCATVSCWSRSGQRELPCKCHGCAKSDTGLGGPATINLWIWWITEFLHLDREVHLKRPTVSV